MRLKLPSFAKISTINKALAAFLDRKVEGLNLSDRVWQHTDQFKDEIEMALDLGIREGKSATSMSIDVRQYLQNPNMLFRRVRDKHGLLQLSKRAKAFHPGQDVYRSSYKNARRLTATENNIAYRTADFLRYQQMDFVVGIQICLSNNHTVLLQPGETTSGPTQQRADGSPKANAVKHLVDICDDLQGRYPKDFKFTGWHPHCRCHVITILKSKDEIKRDIKRLANGETVDNTSVNEVTELPKNFTEWVKDNEERLKGRATLPYFIKDNQRQVNGILGIAEPKKKELSLLKIAEQRHAKRTQTQIDDIIKRARERDIKNLASYLQRYGEFTEYPSLGDPNFRSYRGMENAMNRLTEEQRLEVLEKAKFSGMLNPENFFEEGFMPELYLRADKAHLIDRIKEDLDNMFEGYDVEDTNHYVICLKSGRIVYTDNLEKRLSAKQYEDAQWISASGGLADYKYWYRDATARNSMLEYMGFDEWENGKVIARSKWSPWNDSREDIPRYGAAMKLGRKASKKAHGITSNIGAPVLSEEQQENIRHLSVALGNNTELKPMSYKDANNGACNPLRDNENCQSVVVAFEARRRGLNCYAVKYSSDKNSSTYFLGEHFQDAFISAKSGMPIEPTLIKEDSREKNAQKIRKRVKNPGKVCIRIKWY